MGREEDLTKSNRTIREAEAQLTKLSGDILTLTKEIDRLAAIQNQLQENVNVLKKSKVIAMMAEFKKAKEELKIATSKLELLAGNRKNSQATYNRIEKNLNKAKADYDKLARSIQNNVLTGKFGGKNNGQG